MEKVCLDTHDSQEPHRATGVSYSWWMEGQAGVLVGPGGI